MAPRVESPASVGRASMSECWKGQGRRRLDPDQPRRSGILLPDRMPSGVPTVSAEFGHDGCLAVRPARLSDFVGNRVDRSICCQFEPPRAGLGPLDLHTWEDTNLGRDQELLRLALVSAFACCRCLRKEKRENKNNARKLVSSHSASLRPTRSKRELFTVIVTLQFTNL